MVTVHGQTVTIEPDAVPATGYLIVLCVYRLVGEGSMVIIMNFQFNERYLFYIIIGYLGGSILFGELFTKYFKGVDIRKEAADKNPGTFNAFVYGGMTCGTLTLLADLLKGIVPVSICSRRLGIESSLFALVLAAPVFGHAFSIFHHRNGGKAIAVSFGVLLGLVPFWTPVLILAGFYLLFSLVIPLKSHAHRSILAFLCCAAASLILVKQPPILLGIIMIATIVVYKHCIPIIKEKKSIGNEVPHEGTNSVL